MIALRLKPGNVACRQCVITTPHVRKFFALKMRVGPLVGIAHFHDGFMMHKTIKMIQTIESLISIDVMSARQGCI